MFTDLSLQEIIALAFIIPLMFGLAFARELRLRRREEIRRRELEPGPDEDCFARKAKVQSKSRATDNRSNGPNEQFTKH